MVRIFLMCSVLMVAYGILILPVFPLSFKWDASLHVADLYGKAPVGSDRLLVGSVVLS